MYLKSLIIFFCFSINFTLATTLTCYRLDEYGIVSVHTYEDKIGVCDENFVGTCVSVACFSLINPTPPKCFHYFASNHYTNICIGSNIYNQLLAKLNLNSDSFDLYSLENMQIIKRIYQDATLNVIYSLPSHSNKLEWLTTPIDDSI